MLRKHGLWLGPLLAIASTLSYFLVFTRWQATSDVPYLNFALGVAAVAIALLAGTHAWNGGGIGKRLAAIVSPLLAFAFSALLVVYVFVLSADMPDTAVVVTSGEPVPAVTLTRHDGDALDLARAAEGNVLLVFYRGHW